MTGVFLQIAVENRQILEYIADNALGKWNLFYVVILAHAGMMIKAAHPYLLMENSTCN